MRHHNPKRDRLGIDRQKQIAEFLKSSRGSRDPHAMSHATIPEGPLVPMEDRRMTHDTPCAVGAGGASRDRTGDLLVANQTLSQLSYGPVRLIATAGDA